MSEVVRRPGPLADMEPGEPTGQEVTYFSGGRLFWRGKISAGGEERLVEYDLSEVWDMATVQSFGDRVAYAIREAVMTQDGKIDINKEMLGGLRIE